ncbi:ATP-binding cassette domain-containing protein [Chloroflexota bacterium]
MDIAPSRDALSLQGLTKSHGSLLAVDNLSLDVHRGEIFGFLGPNGAGKTTTINMICGLLGSDSGDVRIHGHLLKDEPGECRKLLGLCPQDLVIWESLTCLEQLEFMARQYDVGPAAARGRARELLDMLGLAGKGHSLAKTLSGGMKRRLNLALALCHDPQVLILDEPQAELDPQSRILVREYIGSLAEKKTVILCTHDMDEVDRLAHRIAIIDHGRLLVLDTPERLKSRIGAGDILELKIAEGHEEELERLQQALPDDLRSLPSHHGTLRLVGVDTPTVLPPVLDRLRETGLPVQDLTIRKKTLEDVFIALTGRRLRE